MNTGLWNMDSGLAAVRRPGMTLMGETRAAPALPQRGDIADGITKSLILRSGRSPRLEGRTASIPLRDHRRAAG